MRNAGDRQTIRLRTVFVSDVHLGSRGCRADLLLEFLKSVEVDNLFLVGDIVDLWAMRKNFFWPQEHNNVLRTVLGKAKGGTRVIYIPGNHDEDLREFCGSVFGNLEIHREFVHETSDGKRLLVMHGDEFDTVVKCSPWLAKLGSSVYDFLLRPQSLRERDPPAVRICRTGRWRAISSTRPRTPCSTSRASSRRWRMRRASAASTAWSADTFIAPRSPTSTACSTATMATGWRAAPRWSKT